MAPPLSWILLITLACSLLVTGSNVFEEDREVDHSFLLLALLPCLFLLFFFYSFIEETIINIENIFKTLMLEAWASDLMSAFANLWLQVYIVYMGDLPNAGDISISSFHTNMLQEVVGR